VNLFNADLAVGLGSKLTNKLTTTGGKKIRKIKFKQPKKQYGRKGGYKPVRLPFY